MSLGCPRLGPGCPESRLDSLWFSGFQLVDGPRWHTSDGVTTATPWSSPRGGRPSGSGRTAVPGWPAAVPRTHARTMPRLPAAPRHSARCDLLRLLLRLGAFSGSLSGSVRRKFRGQPYTSSGNGEGRRCHRLAAPGFAGNCKVHVLKAGERATPFPCLLSFFFSCQMSLPFTHGEKSYLSMQESGRIISRFPPSTSSGCPAG